MNPIDLIKKYYDPQSEAYKILIDHSDSVTRKAVDLALKHPELDIDIDFVKEAGMLHDIGIIMTDAPRIHCYGEYPYIAHGYLGSEILKKEGYLHHALVCERHTGTGMTLEEIIEQNLPIPHREMMPLSIEEQVICFADKFYSKTKLGQEKSTDDIIKYLARFGDRPVNQFICWMNMFL